MRRAIRHSGCAAPWSAPPPGRPGRIGHRGSARGARTSSSDPAAGPPARPASGPAPRRSPAGCWSPRRRPGDPGGRGGRRFGAPPPRPSRRRRRWRPRPRSAIALPRRAPGPPLGPGGRGDGLRRRRRRRHPLRRAGHRERGADARSPTPGAGTESRVEPSSTRRRRRPALSGALLGYDPSTERLVLTGGDTSNRRRPLEETDATWTWDGSTWAAQPSGGLPAPDLPSALATDEATGQLILVTSQRRLPGHRDLAMGRRRPGSCSTPRHHRPGGVGRQPRLRSRDRGAWTWSTAPGGCDGDAAGDLRDAAGLVLERLIVERRPDPGRLRAAVVLGADHVG